MPTPLDNIKKGILTDNMKLVIKGYSSLTGEKIEVAKSDKTAVRKKTVVEKPKKTPTRTKPKKEISQIAEPEVLEVVEEVVYDGIIDLGTTEKQRKQAQLERVSLSKKNIFVDNGRECLEDKKFDQLVSSKTQRAARRPPVGFSVLTCDVCGRTYKVPNDQIYNAGAYICPPCMKNKYGGGR